MNASPEIYGRSNDRRFTEEDFKAKYTSYDEKEIFDYIRDIKDPEHPMSLEELGVVEMELIELDEKDDYNYCCVEFKPTIPHCSMATLIGLAIKVQLLRILPASFKIDVRIYPGTHVSYAAINKQLADKERIAASLENVQLLRVINDCLLFSEPQTVPSFIKKVLKEENKLSHPKVNYIQLSRQPIETYRRWKDIINSNESNIFNSLSFVI